MWCWSDNYLITAVDRDVVQLHDNVITSRATAGIKITQESNYAVFRPQGRHDSRINVKFSTADGSAMPTFTLLGGYLRISGPKTGKFAKKFPKLQAFSPRRGESLARF